MACKYCAYKGFILDPYMASADNTIGAKVCPKCNDTKAFSKFVKEQIFGYEYKEEKPIIIDFAKARKQCE